MLIRIIFGVIECAIFVGISIVFSSRRVFSYVQCNLAGDLLPLFLPKVYNRIIYASGMFFVFVTAGRFPIKA